MLGPGQSTVSLADYGCFVPALVAAMVHPKLPASIWIHTSDLLLLLSASTRGASARPARATRSSSSAPTKTTYRDGRLFQDLCPSLAAAARPGLWWRRWYALSFCQVRPRSAPLSCCWSALQGRLQGRLRGASARVRQGMPRPHRLRQLAGKEGRK